MFTLRGYKRALSMHIYLMLFKGVFEHSVTLLNKRGGHIEWVGKGSPDGRCFNQEVAYQLSSKEVRNNRAGIGSG
jgi:hypothetical protein